MDGYYIDHSCPVLQEKGKIYVPMDKLAEYYGLSYGYGENKKLLVIFEPDQTNTGNSIALFQGINFSEDESEEIYIRYKEAPKYKGNHMYLLLEDANRLFGIPGKFDEKNNVLSLSRDYKPGIKSAPLNIVVNGKKAPDSFHPFITNNRTMVPVRFVTEAMGGIVEWNEFLTDGMQGITIFRNQEELPLTIYLNKRGANISEGTYQSDTFPVLRDETTYVPLRFIADFLSLDVSWNQSTRTVTLKKSDYGENFNQYFNNEMFDRLQKIDFNNMPEGTLSDIFN
ncbi:copper amine oxidase N-terminal domain-containing protein [Peptoniphilus sp. KCTC 25270]|uniref:copper amine oxidase N-terminal domain-containing protein n=1 Tax=Peptoniphilus sp. KCTC 25270 TaxID=2897414 RepID=UPI001E4F03D7|nr:copper amine oxidase N-terminal domain-containing protein [Peptoniphilus sp. KCTC 25270]MCD1147414.1 copper amine oxidase N-terminal domain-containing protein [Peptoniphilus sp. KCTC 25270]